MLDVLRREFVYIWYYFSIQLEQIFRYCIFGMVIGSVISIFAKDKIHKVTSKNPVFIKNKTLNLKF